jgi:hypothetical protein
MNGSNIAFAARKFLCAGSAALLCVASLPSTAITISTSADPADGWRVIAPVGNLEGQPLTAAAVLEWEAANVGWNDSLGYDDSDAAGWHTPVARDESGYGATLHNNVWADPEGVGNTPAYFRRQFELPALPSAAWFGSNIPNDFSNVVDDDAVIYINGFLVLNDMDQFATFMPVTDVLAYLHTGTNLIAVRAHDGAGGNEHFSMLLQTAEVSEPDAQLLAVTAIAALLLSRRSTRSS